MQAYNCCTCKLARRAILTQTLTAPGPFVELDGTRTPPSFFSAYVVLIPLLLGIIAPTAGLGMLVWQNEAYLGACTLGLYLVEVAAQLVSEDVYLKTSKLLSIHLLGLLSAPPPLPLPCRLMLAALLLHS